ncbi:hypothetical protein PMAYCL1PPCAC_15994, partial [Pristionchus mayeri]
FNALALLVIARSTPKEMKDYSIILANTALNDMFEITLHLLLNSRLFLYGPIVAHMSDGPCQLVSAHFCVVLYECLHISIMQTCSLIAISFWYR